MPSSDGRGLTRHRFVYNIVQTMAGGKKKRTAATAEAIFVLVAIGAAIGLGVIGFFLGRATSEKHTASGATTTAITAPATTTAAATTTSTGGAASAGKAIFTANCASCHTLKDAAATGAVGPNLDQLKPNAARVAKQVTNGGKVMPPFKGQLTAAQIAAVAAYVSSVAGK